MDQKSRQLTSKLGLSFRENKNLVPIADYINKHFDTAINTAKMCTTENILILYLTCHNIAEIS